MRGDDAFNSNIRTHKKSRKKQFLAINYKSMILLNCVIMIILSYYDYIDIDIKYNKLKVLSKLIYSFFVLYSSLSCINSRL
jgi:hypothetical protein